MVSSLATASAVTKATTLPHCNDGNYNSCSISKVSFRRAHNPKLRFVATKCAFHEEVEKLANAWQGLQPSRSPIVVKAQLNEVAFDGPSDAASSPSTKSDTPGPLADSKSANETSPAVLATEESISEFISQVASLVKLVDSRDIVELQLKQLDCEVVIRKKEALPQSPPPPVPVAASYAFPPPVSPPASPPLPPAPVPASAPAPSPPAAKSAKSSLPPLKCPMAGTFYRSPGPGEPPFVKVGDKVQKGQVLCIIEAMKLMNEIEADQSGTIIEIPAEDGKPVSVDTPLFVIQP